MHTSIKLILALLLASSALHAATWYGEVLVWYSASKEWTNAPMPITNAVSIAAGTATGHFTSAARTDGTWTNFGTDVESGRWYLPDPIPTNVAKVGYGWIHGYGILDDGNVFDYGAAADPDQDAAPNFYPSPNHWLSNAISPGQFTNTIETSCGDGHSALLTADGDVHVRGTRTSVHSATNITNGKGLHSCWHGMGVLLDDGTMAYHGDDPDPWTYDEIPAEATNGWKLGGGMEFFLLIRSNDTIVAWGRNDHGQIDVPSGLSNLVDVGGGREYAAALHEDGTVTTWGGNASWQTNLPSSMTNVYAMECGFEGISVIKNAQPEAAYYVATNGNDSNPGTQELPFLTVQKGADTATAGYTVFIGQGTYDERVTTQNDGTIDSRIVFDGQGVATIRSFMFSHEYNTLQNATIIGPDTLNSWTIYINRGAHYTMLSNNVFDAQYSNDVTYILRWDTPKTNNLPWGTNCASGCLVASNTFKNLLTTFAITMYGDTNVVVGNQFYNGDSSDWLRIWGRTNCIVANTFSNMVVDLGTEHPDWLQSFDNNGHGAKGCIIESNLVINHYDDSQLTMFSTEPDCDYNGDFTIRNNIFVAVAHSAYSNTRDIKWHNNVFYHCSSNQGPVIIVWTNGHGVQILNNAFIDCGTGTTNTDDGWYNFYGDIGLSNCVADYNMVSIYGQSPNIGADKRPVGDPTGWSRFQWWESNGITAGNAMFVDAPNDFRLQANSPMINAGTNLSGQVDVDYYGTARPVGASWEIGAYEGAGVGAPDSQTHFHSGRQYFRGRIEYR